MKMITTNFKQAYKLLGPECVICLYSALSYYDLTDNLFEKTWVYTPYGKFSHKKELKVIRKRKPNFKIGVKKENGFKITTIERTIVDILGDRKHVHLKEAFDIAKNTLAEKKVKFHSLVSMSKKLSVYERIKEYLLLLS